MLKAECIWRHCAHGDEPALYALQNAWRMACLFCLLFLMIGFSCLYFIWRPTAAFHWLLTSAGINAYVLWLLWTALRKNYTPQNVDLRPHLGVANWLTIARAFLIGALGGFLFQEPPDSVAGVEWLIWVPGAIYIAVILMDYLDGYVARLMRSETRLGEWLDTKIDALGLLVAPLLAIGYDRLPIYYLGVSLAYYLFQIGIWHRKRNNHLTIEIKPHPAKRMIAGFQMGLVAVALLPIFPRPAIAVAATVYMIPLLAGFFRDALVAGGYVNVNHLQQTRWDRQIGFALTNIWPVVLRFIISATVIYLVYDAAAGFAEGKQSLSVAALDASMPFDLPALPVVAAAGLMIASGFMARSSAFLLSLLVAGTLKGWHSPVSLFILLSCAQMLMLTGSGLRSLWQPENKLLWERQGKRHRL